MSVRFRDAHLPNMRHLRLLRREVNDEAHGRFTELAWAMSHLEQEFDMHSRLAEIRLEDARRKPMTPAQMTRTYWKPKCTHPSPKDRMRSAIGEALITLGKRLKPENSVQTSTQFIRLRKPLPMVVVAAKGSTGNPS